jgi:hypothetical protein
MSEQAVAGAQAASRTTVGEEASLLAGAQRTHDGRRAWSISAKRGELDVWFTSDGSVFVEGATSLNIVYALFLQLLEVCPDLALEDRITGELHDRHSLLRLVRRDEQKASERLTVAASLAAA